MSSVTFHCNSTFKSIQFRFQIWMARIWTPTSPHWSAGMPRYSGPASIQIHLTYWTFQGSIIECPNFWRLVPFSFVPRHSDPTSLIGWTKTNLIFRSQKSIFAAGRGTRNSRCTSWCSWRGTICLFEEPWPRHGPWRHGASCWVGWSCLPWLRGTEQGVEWLADSRTFRRCAERLKIINCFWIFFLKLAFYCFFTLWLLFHEVLL